jgi:Xaa-Pro dipeptidase
MGAGPEGAMMVRYHTGKETVAGQDQVTHEFAAAYRHYHACAMSVVVTGKASPAQLSMFSACREALDACEAALRPGATVGEVFDTHKAVVTKAGLGHAALAACGYSLGISYPPTWMDWPMLWTGNPQVIEPGMVFFIHIILLDDRTGLTISLGETAIVTEGACERVTHAPRELVVN